MKDRLEHWAPSTDVVLNMAYSSAPASETVAVLGLGIRAQCVPIN
jgi:hypothetical protein